MSDRDTSLMELGRRLRERRDALRLSRAEVSRRTGVTPTYIYLIEQARSPKGRNPYTPRSEVLLRWTQALDLERSEADAVFMLAGYKSLYDGTALQSSSDVRFFGDSLHLVPAPSVPAEVTPSRKEVGKRRAELLDQMRELLQDAESDGTWDDVQSELQFLLDFVRARRHLTP